ncbi:hypothetical protein ACJX0J_014815, partial [Zea mays]
MASLYYQFLKNLIQNYNFFIEYPNYYIFLPINTLIALDRLWLGFTELGKKKRADDWNRQINEFHGGAGQGIFIQNTTTLTIPNAILAQYHGVIKNPIALSPQFIT